jgi:hypothetical protein
MRAAFPAYLILNYDNLRNICSTVTLCLIMFVQHSVSYSMVNVHSSITSLWHTLCFVACRSCHGSGIYSLIFNCGGRSSIQRNFIGICGIQSRTGTEYARVCQHFTGCHSATVSYPNKIRRLLTLYDLDN